MTQKLGFWAPVSYMTGPQSFTNRLVSFVDSYFDCWVKNLVSEQIAYIIPEQANMGERKVVSHYTFPETRSSLGVALKMASHVTVAIPLVMLATKMILRSVYTFDNVDIRALPAGTLELLPAQIVKVNQVAQELINTGRSTTTTLSKAKRTIFENSYEFKIQGQDRLIFTLSNRGSDYMDNMESVKAFTLAFGLNQIIIPKGKEIEIPAVTNNSYKLYVQEKLDLLDDDDEVDREPTQETTRQLNLLWNKTGELSRRFEWKHIRNSTKITIPISLFND